MSGTICQVNVRPEVYYSEPSIQIHLIEDGFWLAGNRQSQYTGPKGGLHVRD